MTYDIMIVSNASKIISVYNQFLPDLLIIDNFIAQRTAADVVAELKLAGGGRMVPYILFSAASNIEQLARDMDAAAFLPSAIAQTTSDCPRRISPAAKTPAADTR